MYPYATIYSVTKNGFCHACIHSSKHSAISGTMRVIELKRTAKHMPIFDISNTTKILGLRPDNMYKYGGKLI
jgi:hypothetical protein